MAGGNNLLRDPAIERWGSMREQTLRHFKFTPRTTRLGILFGLVVPWGIYELSVMEAVSEACPVASLCRCACVHGLMRGKAWV